MDCPWGGGMTAADCKRTLIGGNKMKFPDPKRIFAPCFRLAMDKSEGWLVARIEAVEKF